MKIKINGHNVGVIGENAALAVESAPFQDWVSQCDPRLKVNMIQIQSVDMTLADRVIFVKFKAYATGPDGSAIPGIVFMRGGSVAILVVLRCGGVKYTVLVNQARLPIGALEFQEIPAGMLDGSGNFTGVTAKELEEELGITVNEEQIVDMTKLTVGEKWPGVYPSPGGCDEYIRLMLYERDISPKELEAFKGRQTGAQNEREKITLSVIPLAELPWVTADMKALAALCLYQTLNLGDAGVLGKKNVEKKSAKVVQKK